MRVQFGGIYIIDAYKDKTGKTLTEWTDKMDLFSRYASANLDPNEENGMNFNASPVNLIPDGDGFKMTPESTNVLFMNDKAGQDFDWDKNFRKQQREFFKNNKNGEHDLDIELMNLTRSEKVKNAKSAHLLEQADGSVKLDTTV